jgi:MinD-like ATPase involved in chromosome partitioning or flagellar assembly/CheY-like chemotaxis protein
VVGKTILIIDSDAASRSFVSRTLRQQQYTVVQVASGKEGLIIAWRDRPDLIIIEPLLPDLSGQQLAVKLRQDPRTSRLPLVALSLDNKNSSRDACLDAGFNEYIVKSGDAVPYLVATVNRLLGNVPEPVAPPPPPSHDGLTFAFVSAKGGIGTSSLCANLAMNVAQNQQDASVAVLDLVLPIGSLAAITGYNGTRNLVTLADLDPGQMTSQRLGEHLFETGVWRFDLLPGSPDPESAAHLQVEKVGVIVEQLRGAYDYVLIDMGRSISSRFTLPLILRSSLIVLIVSTDLSSVALSKTMLDYLRQKGVKEESIFTILNRAVGLEGLTRAEAEKVLGVEIKTTFPYLVHFTLANNQNQPFIVKYPGDNSSVITFKDVAGRLVDAARQLRLARSNNDIRV